MFLFVRKELEKRALQISGLDPMWTLLEKNAAYLLWIINFNNMIITFILHNWVWTSFRWIYVQFNPGCKVIYSKRYHCLTLNSYLNSLVFFLKKFIFYLVPFQIGVHAQIAPRYSCQDLAPLPKNSVPSGNWFWFILVFFFRERWSQIIHSTWVQMEIEETVKTNLHTQICTSLA